MRRSTRNLRVEERLPRVSAIRRLWDRGVPLPVVVVWMRTVVNESLVRRDIAELCSAYLPSDACEVPISDPEPYQIAKAEGVGAEGGIAAQDATASAQMAY